MMTSVCHAIPGAYLSRSRILTHSKRLTERGDLGRDACDGDAITGGVRATFEVSQRELPIIELW